MSEIVSARSCASYNDTKKLRETLEAVLSPQFSAYGNISGKKILLKPNMLAWRRPEDPACAHPAFLLTCAEIFTDAGAKVTIMENPAVQTAPAIIKAMGLEEKLQYLGIQTASFTDFRQVKDQPQMRFHHLEIARDFEEFDAVADLAKAKTHGMMLLTLCVKNLFGLVRGSERMAWHLNVGRDFAQFADMLLDIYLAVKPSFNLVDAVVCMEGNGPGSGTPAERGWVFGGTDALALDSWLAPKLAGPEHELLLIANAGKRGLLPEYHVVGPEPEIQPLILPPPPGLLCEWGVMLPPGFKKYLRELLVARPVLQSEKCVGCGLCAKLCPPQSLKIVNKKAHFNYPDCVRCFCCQEHCPQGAITIRKGTLMRAAESIENMTRRFSSMLTNQYFRKG